VSYAVSGTYLEACNCEAICPCRMIDGVAGGRSTHGICLGVLSWHVERGEAEGVDLSRLAVVMSIRYDDDEPGSPWTLALHVDERARPEAQVLLEQLFLGRLGGARIEALPWVRKPTAAVTVHRSRIELDHVSERRWLRVGTRILLRVGPPVETEQTVTCIVSGHDRIGAEHHAERLELHDDPADAEFVGVCAYTAPFAYASDD
jgi:hypothetical protein